MRNQYQLCCCILFSFAFSAKAYVCPPEFKDRSKLPACSKTSQPQILSDNYPVGAIVVSLPQTDVRTVAVDPMQTTYNLIYTMAASQNPLPLIVLPMTAGQFGNLKASLMNSDLSEAQKKRLLERMAHAETPSGAFTWQQDYFQSTVGARGQVQLRPNTLYTSDPSRNPAGQHFDAVSKVLSSCGVAVGSPLNPKGVKSLPDGASGGNIEALPGGACLIGDDHFKTEKSYDEFVKNICDPKDNIKVPTHWLSVGHTDEIMKVLPNPNKKAPCDFSVALASPKLAVELLEKSPDDLYISPDKIPPEYTNKEQMSKTRQETNPALNDVCRKLEEKKYPVDESEASPSSEPTKIKGSTYYKYLERIEKAAFHQSSGLTRVTASCTKSS